MWLVAGCSVGLGGLASPVDDDGTTPIVEADAATSADASESDGNARPTKPGGHPDATAPGNPIPDASNDAPKAVPPPPGACPNDAAPCIGVPSGWTLVAFAPAQASPCPTGFETAPSQDLVEGPSAANACSCGACTVTQQPSCAAGAINVMYDEDFSGTCGTVAMPSPLGNSPAGACGTDIYQGSYATFDVKYAAPPPSGGTCTAPGMASGNGAVTYASRDRLCQPNSAQAENCDAGFCQPDLSGPYAGCIEAPGDVACPPGPLSVAHKVGTSASVSCADCACVVSGTCSGTLTLYTDTACKKAPYAISTDVCVSVSSAATYKAYQYTGGKTKTVTCEAAAPGAAQNVALAGEQTVCCAQ